MVWILSVPGLLTSHLKVENLFRSKDSIPHYYNTALESPTVSFVAVSFHLKEPLCN